MVDGTGRARPRGIAAAVAASERTVQVPAAAPAEGVPGGPSGGAACRVHCLKARVNLPSLAHARAIARSGAASGSDPSPNTGVSRE